MTGVQTCALPISISYYLGHQQEIEQEITENRLEALMAKYNLEIDKQGFLRFTMETMS